eukprot:gene6639-13449_t
MALKVFSPSFLCFVIFLVPSIMALMHASKRLTSPFRKQIHMAVTGGIIVGGGRIGNLLWELNDRKDVLLKRNEMIPLEGNGPIYVCTRNNDLEDIIKGTPVSRKKDLVFLQNGMLGAFLESKGLADNTQALVYFAVAKKGDTPIDGKTDVNPEGLTAATGKWASDFAERLAKGGLACKVLSKNEWYICMLEKHLWICAFMAVGVKHKCTVGEVESKHNEEIRQLIDEMAKATEKKATGVKFPVGLGDRLCAYSRSVAHFPTALKEQEWRNGWFLDLSFDAAERGRDDPIPHHTALMGSAEGQLVYNALKARSGKKFVARAPSNIVVTE